MAKCTPCLGDDIKDILRSNVDDPHTLQIIENIASCEQPVDIQFCGRGKRAPSKYQQFVGACLREGKSIKECAAEWKTQKEQAS
ncbi:MAG: hypothetical protein QUS09_09085 [Methanotrichaceae archaeon]|nr:hypothetical protein [Methanotrichaceae archaeon]